MCFYYIERRTTIRVGEHRLSTDPDCRKTGSETEDQFCVTHQDFSVEEVIPHESYSSPNRFQNDIAIIRLSRDVELRGKLPL